MRRLAGGVAGAFALLAMILLQPWERLTCTPGDCASADMWGDVLWTWIYMWIYLALPLVVVGIIQVAVLGVRPASQPHDLAVRAALGETQGTAVRAAAARGLRDGLFWVGGAYVITGVTQVVMLVASGWPAFSDGGLWIARFFVGVLVVATLVLAHVIDAARPQRTPVERLFEEAEALAPRRWRRRLGVALAVTTAVASGVLVGLSIAYELAPNFYVSNTARIALTVAIIAAMALALAVLIPASRAELPRWMSTVAARLRGPAGSIVAARSRGVSRAGGRVVLVLGSFGYLLGTAFSADPSPSLSPTYVGYRVFYADIDAEAFADRLREIDGVGGVVVPQAGSDVGTSGYIATTFAVDPAQLEGLDDGLAAILTEHPTAIAMKMWGGNAHLHEAPYGEWNFQPEGVVPLSDCCSVFTSTSAGMDVMEDVTAFLIYSTDPARNLEVQTAAWAITPDDLPADFGEGSEKTGDTSTYWPGLAIQVGLLVIALGTPMIALAVGVVRARRGDDATLAALGSSAAAIRSAIVIETAAVAAFAMTVGLGLGAVTRAGIAVLQRAHGSLTGVITDSYLATAFGSVAWLALAAVLVATVVTMATTAWIASRGGATQLPAEQLRAAQAGRVS